MIQNYETGCWEWISNKIPQGYGMFWHRGKSRRAHRISWEMKNGKIPKGILVLHKCDNPSCVNPDHLFLGNYKLNSLDMLQKKRHRAISGEKHYLAKLNILKVRKIREEYSTGNFTQRDLASKYKISQPSIGDIINNKTWRKS